MSEDLLKFLSWVVGFGGTIAAAVIGWDKWVKSRIEIQRLKAVDFKSIKELMELTKEMENDIEELRKADETGSKELGKLEMDIRELRGIINRFMEYQFNKR